MKLCAEDNSGTRIAQTAIRVRPKTPKRGLPITIKWNRRKMNRKHILVVDDERNMLRTMEFILEAAHYKVTAADDGREALERILAARDSNSPIDLLIVDIRMPGLTGMELMDELDRLNVDMPVFVITGHGDKELVIELLRKGCREYLDKPFDDEELVKRVATLLDEKKRSSNRTDPAFSWK